MKYKNSYIHGNTAKKLEYDLGEKRSEVEKVIKKSKNNYNKLFGVTVLAFVFILVMIIMQRYAEITVMNYEYNEKIESYNELKNENDKIKIDLEKNIDLGEIKLLAEEMGFQEAENDQIVQIVVPKKDFIEISDEYKDKSSILSSSFASLFGID
jgi:hypothetical protein